MTDALAALREFLDDAEILAANAIEDRYLRDFSGIQAGKALALVRPRDVEQLSRILAICDRHGQAVVPQGGMTGICAGALPSDGAIILSLEKLNGVEEVDRQSGTMTVLAGTPLTVIQEAAEEAGFMFPLDIGSRDSCLIGGNISTNAGGNRVVKYGMTRGLILGLEVVLANGSIVTSLNKMLKNNSGYDLKQLFIGSEGTLGIITRAVLRLSPRPRSRCTALCALESFDDTISLLHRANEFLPGGVSSFEVMWSSFYTSMTELVSYLDAPLGNEYPLYVILECMGQDAEKDPDTFQAFLEQAFEAGLIVDAVPARSESDTRAIWAVRDSVVEFARLFPEYVGFDVSVPISTMEKFVADVCRVLDNRWPEQRKLFFGHIGDSNLHIIVDITGVKGDIKKQINDAVYQQVKEQKGAVSAEHGIGLSKLDYLTCTASETEVALMHTLKQALDPGNILNPGKVLGGNR